MTQALAIDAMAESGGEMPLNRNIERGQALRRLKQRLRWNEVVAVAMDEENRRAGFDLGGKFFGIEVGRQYQQSGIADDRHRGSRAAQTDMQRHHRALAEADQRQRGWRQLVPGELGIEKAFEHRRGFVDTDPALIRIAKGQREPLPANRRLTARLGRVRRDEGGMGQHFLPCAADLDQVVAVSTIAVQENDELLGRAGTGRKPRSIECPDSGVRHGRTRPEVDLVTKKQRMWPYSNAIFEYAFCLPVLLDVDSSCGDVATGIMCDVGHTVCPGRHGGDVMHYLSIVADQRPMLRVAGEIVLAFSCATPLVLLLCFLV